MPVTAAGSMFLLFQLTSSILYDFILVIIFTAALAVLIGRLAAREHKKPIRKLPKVEGINRTQRRKELASNLVERRFETFFWRRC